MNYQNFIISAAALIVSVVTATTVNAAETNETLTEDTTVVVGNQKIAIDTDSGRTVVKVYDMKGNEYSKTREAEFVDGQEVERVFVGSPFIPTAGLQKISFKPQFPTVFAGFSVPSGKVMNTYRKYNYAHAKTSFSIGVTGFSIAVPFDKSYLHGLTAAYQLTYNRVGFEKNYQLIKDGNGNITQQHNQGGQSSYMSYWTARFPIMYSISYDGVGVAFGVSPEFRFGSQAHYTDAVSEEYHTDNLVKTFGLNLETNITLGPVVITASYGLLPLLRKSGDLKLYNNTITIGLDIWRLLGKSKR